MGGIVDSVGKAVSNVVGAANDVVEGVTGSNVIENVSNIFEETWDNEAVQTAAMVAAAYYGGSYLLGSPGTYYGSTAMGGGGYVGGSGILGATASAFPTAYASTAATLGSIGSAVSSFGSGVGTSLLAQSAGAAVGGALMGGGGGGFAAPSKSVSSRGRPSTLDPRFEAGRQNLAMDPRVIEGLQAFANSNVETIQATRNALNRVSMGGPNLQLGRTVPTVRSTTKALSGTTAVS
tara:strand:- start:7112 stop:7816 length:705 start_codon:yes stop_codon:yes gene_type:complete